MEHRAFHVSNSAARETILRDGLALRSLGEQLNLELESDPEPMVVVVWWTLSDAGGYVNHVWPTDIWRVDVSGIELEPVPFDDALVCGVPIARERVELVSAGDRALAAAARTDPAMLLRALEQPSHVPFSLRRRLEDEVPETVVVAALEQVGDGDAQVMLMHALGHRGAVAALPEMITRLDDPDPDIRHYAADAIGDLGAVVTGRGERLPPEVGQALFDRYTDGASSTMLSAMGAVGYRPAIPLLITKLESPVWDERDLAAWALGFLRATEARDPLAAALAVEADAHAQGAMRWALERVTAEL